MDKNKLIIIGSLLVAVFVIVFAWSAGSNKATSNSDQIDESGIPSVEVVDGVQYIRVLARGGYSPRSLIAQAGIPTKLIVETKNTFDCSRAFTLPSLGVTKMLPQTGVTEFDLGNPTLGSLQGLCTMGMYGFAVNFK